MKNSCSALPVTGFPLLLANLLLDGSHDASRCTKAKEHPPNVLRSYGQFARQLGKIWSQLLRSTYLRYSSAKMNAHIETSAYSAHYSNPTQEVKKIITNDVNAESRPEIREALVSLRKRMNYTQRQMAELLGVSQAQVAKWEGSRKPVVPPGQIFGKLSDYAAADERWWWLKQAGINIQPQTAESSIRYVPLLRDPAAAGTPRAMDETEISDYLQLPKRWLPVGGRLHAIEIRGDSMEPTLRTGFVVIVDVDQRCAEQLVDHMVLAREGEGVTVKWLRRLGSMLMLVPENIHTDNPLQMIQPDCGIEIVGAVVKWIGQPTATKKGK